MGISNAEGPLVLATGNKSEIAVGYSTIYGDAVGGFAPIKDVPKSLVWELSRWRNSEAAARGQTPLIPENSIEKEPSAELRPDQRDSDSLPDYALLDEILDAYVGRDSGAAELLEAGFDAVVVTGCVVRGETRHDRHIVDAAFGQFSALAVRFRRPVALAVLTVEDLKQARSRAGGDKGDAGAFAMRAALRTLDTMRQVREEAKR